MTGLGLLSKWHSRKFEVRGVNAVVTDYTDIFDALRVGFGWHANFFA